MSAQSLWWSKPLPEKPKFFVPYKAVRRTERVSVKPAPAIEVIALDMPFNPKRLSARHMNAYIDHVAAMIQVNPLAVPIGYRKRGQRTKFLLPNGTIHYERGAA